MRNRIMKKVEILCLLMVMVPNLVWAAGDSWRPPRDGRKPPQEAFDACKGKSEGASVEVTTPHGKLKATCKLMECQLVAIPEGMPPPPQSGPNSACQ